MSSFPAHLTARIEERIAELLASKDDCQSDQKALAAHLHALPLYADMGGCIALKPNGDLVFVHSNQSWNPPSEVSTEVEPHWRTVAFVAGCEKYPELAELVPPRPANAKNCSQCQGSGRVHVSKVSLRCGACSGLGWEGLSPRPR